MFVKLISGKPHIAQIPDEEAARMGYKLAVFAEKPTAPSGYHAESRWEEETDSIVQSWTLVEDAPVEYGPIEKAEAYDILVGGAT